ncbi:DUF262 domain-containing protein [Paenibacillus chitinolyticus]|uniref:DUF262 domain-containing protein n=1 Tax=Paenibacillus chitinolyticus TaxID=79263 RepID=UPI0035DF9553
MEIKINYSRPLVSVQDAVNFIDKGEKYIKSGLENLTDDEQLEVLHGIILSPDYQRQYRSTAQEETSIIESLLLNIPIPEIFLVRTSSRGIQLRHVMDGQHRLTAIYRYIKDRFPLKNLEILGLDMRYNDRKFSDLAREDKIKILGSHLSILEFSPFDNDDIEIELFKRYNRNTKPLEKHEIAMATYYSKTSQFIGNFINKITDEKETSLRNERLTKIYNITPDRKNKQKNHQEMCIIFSILDEGPDFRAKDGVEASTNLLKRKAQLFKADEDERLDILKIEFDTFNEFVLKLADSVDYPFSSSIYKEFEKRMAKYHVGVSMVLAIMFYYFRINLEGAKLLTEIKYILENSPLGDVEYNASSTNTRSIMNYLSIKNKVFDKHYSSMTLRRDKYHNVEQHLTD